MSKIKISLSALALIAGISGAFATKARIGEDCYKNASGQFVVKPSETVGNCNTIETNNNCNFEYTGGGTAGVDQDPENYNADGQANRRWNP